jgi:hypothetical protein
MRNRKLAIILLLLIWGTASLACSFSRISGTSKQPDEVPAEPGQSELPVVLGEEFRCEECGLAFNIIPDYTAEGLFGFVFMQAPDAEPDAGPLVVFITSHQDQDITLEDLYHQASGEFNDSVSIVDHRDIRIQGYPAKMGDLVGIGEGDKMVLGQLVAVLISPRQTVISYATAPDSRWKEELRPAYNAVLNSLHFFDPQDPAAAFPIETPVDTGEILHQWASFVTATSSYDDPDWGPMQAAGPPDTFSCDDLPTAWSSLNHDGVEVLELQYDQPVLPLGVNIHQSFSPSQVEYVALVDIYQNTHVVYQQEPWIEVECPYILEIYGFVLEVPIDTVVIHVNQAALDYSWNQIDAVELVGLVPVGFEQANTPVNTGEDARPIRQWGASAYASSEYSATNGSALRATGKPDVFQCGENPNAWAPSADNTEEYLVVTYEVPVLPTEVSIYLSAYPSQVVEIQFLDVDGEAWLFWHGNPEKISTCPDKWVHTIELDESIYVNAIIIFVDQSITGWGRAEIDAVELVGYPQGVLAAQTSTAQDPPVLPTEAAPVVSEQGQVPANFTDWMAGPIYQGWINIQINQTRVEDLDKIMTIPGRRETSSYKPRDNHADTFIYDFGRDKLLAYISVTTDGVVYKKAVTANSNLTGHGLTSVNRENYEALKAIYNRDKVIPYVVMANLLESPGFLREEYIRQDDGKVINTYNWYSHKGDKIVGIFYDGLLTGVMGLNFIETP